MDNYQLFVVNGNCVDRDYETFIDLHQQLLWITDEMIECEMFDETNTAEYALLAEQADHIKSALGYEV